MQKLDDERLQRYEYSINLQLSNLLHHACAHLYSYIFIKVMAEIVHDSYIALLLNWLL